MLIGSHRSQPAEPSLRRKPIRLSYVPHRGQKQDTGVKGRPYRRLPRLKPTQLESRNSPFWQFGCRDAIADWKPFRHNTQGTSRRNLDRRLGVFLTEGMKFAVPKSTYRY